MMLALKMRASSVPNKYLKGGEYEVSLTSAQGAKHKSIQKGGDKE